MGRIRETLAGGRRRPLCLIRIGDRVCVALKAHPGMHTLIPLAPTGRMRATELRREGFKVRSVIERRTSREPGQRMEIVAIFGDGAVLARAVDSDRFFSLSADRIAQNFAIV